MAQKVKNLPAMQATWVRSLGWEDPLEKAMAAHTSILAWRIPWTDTGPQLPAYLLWEPSTQPSLADDLLCASSGHPAMGKAGPGALQPLF